MGDMGVDDMGDMYGSHAGEGNVGDRVQHVAHEPDREACGAGAEGANSAEAHKGARWLHNR